MTHPPFSYLHQMQECAANLLDGASGPLNAEQKELVSVIADNCRRAEDHVDLMLDLIWEAPSPQTCSTILHDLKTLFTPVIGYGELIHAGVTGQITHEQRIALQAILILARQVQGWAEATFSPSI
ncbi:MAG: hypothetical protein JXQ72_02490 [Anaerolineae bacterium]|nr:hypothetical protein [Anaerolineae bacterium]